MSSMTSVLFPLVVVATSAGVMNSPPKCDNTAECMQEENVALIQTGIALQPREMTRDNLKLKSNLQSFDTDSFVQKLADKVKGKVHVSHILHSFQPKSSTNYDQMLLQYEQNPGTVTRRIFSINGTNGEKPTGFFTADTDGTLLSMQPHLAEHLDETAIPYIPSAYLSNITKGMYVEFPSGFHQCTHPIGFHATAPKGSETGNGLSLDLPGIGVVSAKAKRDGIDMDSSLTGAVPMDMEFSEPGSDLSFLVEADAEVHDISFEDFLAYYTRSKPIPTDLCRKGEVETSLSIMQQDPVDVLVGGIICIAFAPVMVPVIFVATTLGVDPIKVVAGVGKLR